LAVGHIYDRRENLNEERVRQIVDLEQRAQAIYDAAVREAEQLPVQAEKEVRVLIEKAQAEAQTQARQLVADAEAQAQAEGVRVLEQAEQDAERMKALAMGRFDRAVGFVLNRVTGRE
jgi:V/A-type H+-transporting ATPase subunit G/H